MEIEFPDNPRMTKEYIDTLSEEEAIALYMDDMDADRLSAKFWFYEYHDRVDELLAKDPEAATRMAEVRAEIARGLTAS